MELILVSFWIGLLNNPVLLNRNFAAAEVPGCEPFVLQRAGKIPVQDGEMQAVKAVRVGAEYGKSNSSRIPELKQF